MGNRTSWTDDAGNVVIDDMAKKLEGFVQAMADGVVSAAEVEEQEARVVALMKEVEPALDDEMHEKVTHLLCELTALDIMQVLHTAQEARPTSTWRP